MSFLGIEGKRFLALGLSNRKSVAWAVGAILESEGAEVIYSVRNKERLEQTSKLLDGRTAHVCDVENKEDIIRLADSLQAEKQTPLAGILHSIAFANFSEGLKPFHETKREDFLQATQITAFSLVEIANACKSLLAPDASVVTIGISSTQVTAENYGYVAPIKAALEASVRYLAKSFSSDSEIRFNSVNAGPLKTRSSAGIPGYLENYLYAEKLTFRKRALATDEVANLATFLLSPRSSGINGQGIVIDAGMGLNYFDQEVVRAATRPE
ncbi:MAG: SDR family oxidoreductase [Opitutales bacterium]